MSNTLRSLGIVAVAGLVISLGPAGARAQNQPRRAYSVGGGGRYAGQPVPAAPIYPRAAVAGTPGAVLAVPAAQPAALYRNNGNGTSSTTNLDPGLMMFGPPVYNPGVVYVGPGYYGPYGSGYMGLPQAPAQPRMYRGLPPWWRR